MGAADLLCHLRASGLALSVKPDGALFVGPAALLTDAFRADIRANREQLLALLSGASAGAHGPPTVERAHQFTPAWTDSEIATFAFRQSRLLRLGLSEGQAERMAERLVRRDLEQDNRVACVECRQYRPGRCNNHRSAGLTTSEVGADLAIRLQRCPGFQQLRQ